MPKLIIDNIPITVADGTSVLEAAQAAGIPIPHFCWHPALGKAGACRVCAVKLLEGPVKGIQMSCMLPAADGMVVSTIDEEAVAMRRQVIEWLMINHPHDCPVCDEGGECLLQDFTIAGGHAIRRYGGKKRTHVNQELGPHIEHEMNRCIQCYRCVRFYQEFAGGTDFGVMGSAARVYFGRFGDGTLESPFSGNLVDICPTGVFTDKTARFRARYWDYEMSPSICPHCSLGCNTTPVARYRELLKVIARRNDQVNGWFICNRGRFGNSSVNDPARPRTPLVDGRETTWDEALDDLINRIGEVQKLHGPRSIALVASPRLSLEGCLHLSTLSELIGATPPCYFQGREERERSMAAVALLTAENSASPTDVRTADCIAIVDCDLLEEGPMLALAMRQAWRNGAPVFLVGSRSPLSQAEAVGVEAIVVEYAEEVPFALFDRPVIICGTRHSPAPAIELIRKSGIRSLCLLPGPNGFCSALLSAAQGSSSLEKLLRGDNIKGVISVEADLPATLPKDILFRAAIDWSPTGSADIVLPAAAWTETDGTFVNCEGRAQRFKKVMNPGIPLKSCSPEIHPPRTHGSTAPGSDVRSTTRIIAELIKRMTGKDPAEPLSERWESLRDLDPEGEGTRIGSR